MILHPEKLASRPYQVEGATKVRRNLVAGGALLLDYMGLGKSLQALVAVEGVPRVAIVADGLARGVWQEEIAYWLGEEAIILYEPKDLRKIGPDTRFVITNSESVRLEPNKVKGKVNPLRNTFMSPIGQFLSTWQVRTFIIDEGHKMRNRKARWTGGMFKLASHVPVIFITGTPIMNCVEEFWVALRLVRPKTYRSFWKFMKKHANARPPTDFEYAWQYTAEATDPEALWREVEPFTVRRTLEDVGMQVGNAPPPQNINLLPTPEQTRLMKAIAKDLIVNVGEDANYLIVDTELVKTTRLRQVAISPRLVGSKDLGNKIPALVELAEDASGKVLVFSCFAKALVLAAEELNKAGVGRAMIDGSVPPAERMDILNNFRDSKTDTVLLLTIDLGGTSITVTEADTVVFLDEHWNPGKNQQAWERLRSHLQNRPTFRKSLRTEGSIDEIIFSTTKRKEDLAAAILDWARKMQ